MALWHREQALLDRMQEIAEASRHLPDAKTRALIDWIREHLCPRLPVFGRRATGRRRTHARPHHGLGRTPW